MQSSIRRVRDASRCWKLLFIDSRLLLRCGAGRGARRERERRASAALAYGRGELCGSWVNLSTCWGQFRSDPVTIGSACL